MMLLVLIEAKLSGMAELVVFSHRVEKSHPLSAADAKLENSCGCSAVWRHWVWPVGRKSLGVASVGRHRKL